jgi:hypothetical protein
MTLDTGIIMYILWLLGALLLLWERIAKMRDAKRSADGDASDKISAAWERFSKPLQERLEIAEAELTTAQEEIEKLKKQHVPYLISVKVETYPEPVILDAKIEILDRRTKAIGVGARR